MSVSVCPKGEMERSEMKTTLFHCTKYMRVWFLERKVWFQTSKKRKSTKDLPKPKSQDQALSALKKGKSNAHPVCQSAILRTPHLTNNSGKKYDLFFQTGKHLEKVGKWTKILFKTYPFWNIPEIHIIKSNRLDLAITKNLDSSKKHASQAWRWESHAQNHGTTKKNPRFATYSLKPVWFNPLASHLIPKIPGSRWVFGCLSRILDENPSFGLVRKSFNFTVGPLPLGLVPQLGTVTPPRRLSSIQNWNLPFFCLIHKNVAFF